MEITPEKLMDVAAKLALENLFQAQEIASLQQKLAERETPTKEKNGPLKAV